MFLWGTPAQEPHRRSLGRATQRLGVLQIELENRVGNTLAQCRERITRPATPSIGNLRARSPPDLPEDRDQNSQPAPSGQAHTQRSRLYTTCDALLSQRCPACFGGRPLKEGAGIQVATDGNFHHRHRRSAGDCPTFFHPCYFLSKSQVDAVGKRIEQARKRPLRSRTAAVPGEAIDRREPPHEAADGKKQKTPMESYDDTGVMALICRHDIPPFFANIDAPGEQQKHSTTPIEHLCSPLPPQAAAAVPYGVGCALDRSLAMVGLTRMQDLTNNSFTQHNILNSTTTSRLRFATTAMHAHGHEWACQLGYNPRILEGLGLTDDEGMERLWSRFITLTGIERSSSVSLHGNQRAIFTTKTS